MTQSDLAEKMFVTRQTVSSWENGRTQPDIDSLTALSQALSVSVEELIYGEKPKLVDDGRNEKARKQMITVFSILASLLVGVGGVLVFVNYWNEFPHFLKTIFCVAPMLLGQAAAVFTFIKKYNKIPWREGASVLWCAGVAGTVALCDSLFSLPTDAFTCMFIDALLFIPIVFVLNAAAPLIAVYILSAIAGAAGEGVFFSGNKTISAVLIFFVPVLFGAVYCFLHRMDREDTRFEYSIWITLLAFLTCSVIFAVQYCENLYIAPVIAVFMFAFVFKDISPAFRIIPTIALPVLSVLSSLMFRRTEYPDYCFDRSFMALREYLFLFLSVACAFASLTALFKKNRDGKSGVFFIVSTFLIFAMSYIGMFEKIAGSTIVYIIIFVIAMAQGVSLVSLGARENRFLPLNVGLLTIIALIMEIVFAQEIDILMSGFIMIFFGVILFVINYRLARKGKEKKEVRSDEEQ